MPQEKGIPIRIDPLFIILVMVLSLFNGNFVPMHVIMWMIVIVVSVLFHEFGHALTALFFGQRASIQLVGFGGLTLRQGPKLSSLREFILVLNGPLASLLLAICAALVYYSQGEAWPKAIGYLLQITVYANIFWTMLNLLPILPLDGGHLLRIILTAIFGVRGMKASLFVSFILSLAIAVLFFLYGQLLLGSFFMLFTFEAFRSWQSSLAVADRDEDVNLLRLYKNAEKAYHHGDLEGAMDRFRTITDEDNKGVLHHKATARMAEILSHQGKYQQAYTTLISIQKDLDTEEQMLLQQVCLHLQHWQEAISIGNSIYKSSPQSDVAIANALAHAQLSQASPAIGWLQNAKNTNLQNLLKQPEFDPIRNDPRFIALTKSAEPELE